MLKKKEMEVPRENTANQDLIKALRGSINYLRQDVPMMFPSYFTVTNLNGDFQARETDFDGVD